jgi:membrane protein YqaA with SNARE-associated domain
MLLRELFSRRYGSPVWDTMLRLTAGLGLVAAPMVVLFPEVGGLAAFALASVWVHGPASPFLPASYEPILMMFGRVYPPVLLALIGTGANLFAEYLNYHLFAELLARKELDRLTGDRRVQRLVALFNRRPFATSWFVAWSPLPDWTIRILAPLGRYPVAPWLLAVGLGRFPRFWLLASLGRWIHLDMRLMGWLALVPALAAVAAVARAVRRRSAKSLTPAVPIPTPVAG